MRYKTHYKYRVIWISKEHLLVLQVKLMQPYFIV